MATTQTIVRVLVASPSDLSAERDVVDEVVTEMNATWTNHVGVRLETIRWERDTHPAIGSDPQNVINTQVGDDYDILLCMLGLTLGRATPRAQSGTVEEYERALARRHSGEARPRIMAYFKDVPVVPSQIDLVEYQRIADFREQLGRQGVLYASFSAGDELKRTLRIHLAKEVQEFLATQSQSTRSALPEAEAAPPPVEVELEHEEEGYFDLVERGMERTLEVREVVGRLTEATEQLGAHISAIAKDLVATGQDATPAAVKNTRRLIDLSAAALARYAERIEVSLPMFKMSYGEGMEAYGQATVLMVEIGVAGQKKREALREALNVLEGSAGAIRGAIEPLRDLLEVIRSLPRLTTSLIRSRRRARVALDALIVELEAAAGHALETRQVIDQMVRGQAREGVEPVEDASGR